ncbi:RebB family R body protein [Roseivirga sp.]|uniref:RebB family R body protein n=1 Tax=Roseivirga sp. TaxID=1964215 RepID=UPI003B522FC9
MPQENPSNQNDAAAVIKEGEAACTALARSIAEQNHVLLTFCNQLIDNTLEAMAKLSSIDMNIAKEGASKRFKEAVKSAAAPQIAKAKGDQQAAPDKSASPTQEKAKSAAGPLSSLEPNISTTYQMCTGQVMENAVHAQQQLFVIAQATTTQTIENILSMTPAVLAMSVKEILDDNKKSKP